MHKKHHRVERVAEQIQKEIAQILQFELGDPRLGMLTIVGVDVSRDLSHAKIYFSLLDKADLEKTEQVLTDSKKFIRSTLAKRMKSMRIVPSLSFHYDPSVERGSQLSALIDQAIAIDKENAKKREEE